MSELAHDPGRFARAVELARRDGGVTRLGDRQFTVAGQDEPEYFVDLGENPACYCCDMRHNGWREGHLCKHILASRLKMQDPTLYKSLMEFAYAEQTRKVS